MREKRGIIKTEILVLAIVLSSCFCVSGCFKRKSIYTIEELNKYLEARLDPQTLQEITTPYEINEEIAQLAKKETQYLRTDYDKAVALVNKIIDVTALNITYDNEATKTAINVYREGRANCLSFTNLFVGMARAVYMNVVFVDVTSVQFLSQQGDIMVHNGHICAGLFYSNSFILIDFAPDPRRRYLHYRIIDDVEAVANYYNNLGFERTRAIFENEAATDDGSDLQYYQLALSIKPDFPKAHNNLGVAYVRRNKFDEAQKAYETAVKIDSDFAPGYGNLATLLYREGKYREAVMQFRKAIKKSIDPHHYQYLLGMNFFAMKQYPDAAKEFEKALRYNPNYLEAYNGLGMVYNSMGKVEKAQEMFNKVKQLKEQLRKMTSDDESL